MGFESGSLSFHAFYLSKDFVPGDVEKFAARPLPPLKTLTGDQPLHGWAGPLHALDQDLSEAHCWRGDWLWLAHVTARKAVPPSYLRATLLSELEVERRARGVEFLPRAAKTEVRERVAEALLRDAQPAFGSMECAIDLRRRLLLATALTDNALQLLCPFFRETTGVMPVLCCPESAAYRLRGIDANALEPLPLTPNPAALPADAEPAEGASGSRTVVVEIGDFVPAAQGTGKTFEQCHVGVIVEGIRDDVVGSGLPDGTEAWGKVEIEEEKDGSASSGGKTIAYNLYQHKQAWDATQARFVDKPGSRVLVGSIPAAGDGGGGVPYVPGGPELAEDEDGTLWELAYFCEVALSAEGVPSLVKTEHVAWRRQVAHHADDHTEGVL